jgi:hypothetical protein
MYFKLLCQKHLACLLEKCARKHFVEQLKIHFQSLGRYGTHAGKTIFCLEISLDAATIKNCNHFPILRRISEELLQTILKSFCYKLLSF